MNFKKQKNNKKIIYTVFILIIGLCAIIIIDKSIDIKILKKLEENSLQVK